MKARNLKHALFVEDLICLIKPVASRKLSRFPSAGMPNPNMVQTLRTSIAEHEKAR